MPGKRAFLNTGSVGVAARPVVQKVCDYLEQSAALQMEGLHPENAYPRWGYEALDSHRSELAKYVGCTKDELAITHNATEAMPFIAGGMPLDKGDEILITDQEHPSGHGPWRVRETKGEVSVRVVDLP